MNRAVLITGAAKRLGAAMATHLAQAGHDIAIHYHSSADEAAALAQKLSQNFGIKSALVQADLQNRERLLEIVPEAVAQLGRPLDTLINNASTIHFDRLDEPPFGAFATWDENIRTNLEAPYFLMEAFAAQCEGQGAVINMIDQRVLRPTPNFSSYGVAKAALYALTKTAAQALAPNIRVNAIGPGTTLQGEAQTDEAFARHRRLSVLERGADESDILDALDYLLNAQNVTGQMIAVDGGQHLIWQLPQE